MPPPRPAPVSQRPEGQRYLCLAKSIIKGGYCYNALRLHLSIGLGRPIADASALIYSDGLDLANWKQTVPIGMGRQVCPTKIAACARTRPLQKDG